MNRRKFLTAGLAATAGGILVAADMASAKTFFLPPAGGWRGYADGGLVPLRDWELVFQPVNCQMYLTRGVLEVGDLANVAGSLFRVTSVELFGGKDDSLALYKLSEHRSYLT